MYGRISHIKSLVHISLKDDDGGPNRKFFAVVLGG